MPVDLSNYPNWQKLVDTNPHYRQAWLEDRFPPKSVAEGLPSITSRAGASIPEATQANKGGVGTELSKLLAKWHIRASEGCKCKSRALEMDRRGIEWCEKNIELIVDWLEEEATKRHLPFVRSLGKSLVNKAIRNAKDTAKRALLNDPIHQLANTFEMRPAS
ncbi:hypothetical protein M0R72_21245 [Candidatus Pacearchaeota archaeon]|jgi:hypothetical protein|nr:hypothetical protein [Candidatus Pacearchaeota archaeon]